MSKEGVPGCAFVIVYQGMDGPASLIEAIREDDPSLETISGSGIALDLPSCELIGRFLGKAYYIETLDLSECKIQPEGAVHIAGSVDTFSNFREYPFHPPTLSHSLSTKTILK